MCAWCVPCGANTGKAETVVVRAVMRNAVVMKAVPKRMDRVKEEGRSVRGRPGLARAQVCEDRRRNASGNSSAFAVVVGGVDQGREVRCWLFNSRAGRGRRQAAGDGAAAACGVRRE